MNMLNIIRNTDNSLINRMNAEGMTFAAIETAIIKCGDKARTGGWVTPPEELANMASSDILTLMYQNRYTVKKDQKYFFARMTGEEQFVKELGEVPSGTRLECQIKQNHNLTQILVEKTGNNYAIVKVFDLSDWQFENSPGYFLPPGIRAAVAAEIKVDINSNTFISVFDAIVDSQY